MNDNRKRPKVVILSRSFAKATDAPLKYIEEHGVDYELVRNSSPEDTEYIARMIGDADGVITGSDVIDRYVMDRCPNLRVVSKHGVGLDSVDRELAKARGIAVMNTPDANNESVGDLTLLFMLALVRQFEANRITSATPDWSTKPLANDLYLKTVGIVGYGKIGRAVARRLVGFNVTLLVYDPYLDSQAIETPNTSSVPLDELLGNSDIVTLHMPLTKDNTHFINEKTISMMKDGAMLINTSRGGLVDQDALHRALVSGKLGGAGLDVFAKEPPVNESLLTLPCVVATPHIAPHTKEANYRMRKAAAANVVKKLKELP